METKRFRLLMVLFVAVMMLTLSANVISAESNAVTTEEEEEDSVEGKTTRMEAILGLVNSALTYGRNLEGSYYPNLFVDGINVDTKEPVVWTLNGVDYYFTDFYRQQNLMKILDGLTVLTGDESYREIAYEQYQFRFEHLTDENGLLYAGAHTLVDAKTGKMYKATHETKGYLIPWNLMWAADAEGTKRFIEAYWNAHIDDWTSLDMDRHGQYNREMGELWDSEYLNDDPRSQLSEDNCAFVVTANDLMEAAYFLSLQTGDEAPARWADNMMGKILGIQHDETGLHGSKYGTSYSYEYGYDRFIYNFTGVEALNGYNETQYVTRNTIKSTAGYAPQSFVPIYNETENEKIYEYITGNMLGVARYVYDEENHRFNTPMMYDGFDVGGITSLRDGYYLNAGKSFAEYESVFASVLQSAIDVYVISGEKEIWDMARVWAENVGLGDIGTDLGENVNVNLNTTSASAANAMAVVTLYKYTESMDYYQLACKIADNIIEKYYHNGLFYTEGNAYASFDTESAYAVFAVEMMAQGKLDEIVDLKLSHGSTDIVYDGSSRTGIDVIYGQKTVAAESVTIDREEIGLVVDITQNYIYPDTEGHQAESVIRQLASLGVVECKEDGNFYPDEEITCAEFVRLAEKLCGITGLAVPAEVIAKNEQLITREEMAAVLVCALKAANPNESYYMANALYRFTDTDIISEWARNDVDIAINYRIMEETDVNLFDAKGTVTRAEAAVALKNLSRYIVNDDIKTLTAVVGPEDVTDDIIMWATSNPMVVEVDLYGNLFAVGVGEATVTATVGNVSDSITVTVGAKESWMLQNVYFDGVAYELFQPSTLEYAIELPLGTSVAPVITGVSYDGRAVVVNYPESLPGIVEFYVDTEHKYEIYFDPCFVEYLINESFDDKESGTRIQDIQTGSYHWQVTLKHADVVMVVDDPKGETENDKCMILPYDSVNRNQEWGQLKFPTKEYTVGEAADDNLIIVDVDMMFENITAEDDINFSFRVGDVDTHWYHRVDFRSDLGGMYADKTHKAYLSKIVTDKYFNVKMVINKKDLTADFYLNDKLIVSNQVTENACDCKEISKLMFNMAVNLDTDAKWYLDNLKIYELTPEGFDIVMEEVTNAVPEVTVGGIKLNDFDLYTQEYTVKLAQGENVPEVIAMCVDSSVQIEIEQAVQVPGDAVIRVNGKEYTIHFTYDPIVKAEYNGFEVGTLISTIGWEGNNGRKIYENYINESKVVEKPVSDTSSTDNCIVITHSAGNDTAATFSLPFNQSIIIGDEADDNLLVVSMDAMVPESILSLVGSDESITTTYHNDWFRISLRGSSNKDVQRLKYVSREDGTIGLYECSSNKKYVNITPGEFFNIRIVLDKKTKQADYYIGNAKWMSIPCYDAGADETTLTKLVLYWNKTIVGIEPEFYFDNFEIYEITREAAEELFATDEPTITIDGVVLDEFDIEKNVYDAKLSAIGAVPEVKAIYPDKREVVFTYTADLNGESGTATGNLDGKTYTINFTYEYLVKENYNSFADNTLLSQTGNYWSTITDAYKNYAKVVAVTDGDTESDKCFVIKHASGVNKDGQFNLSLESYNIVIGDEADNNLLVISMDAMVPKALSELADSKYSSDWLRIMLRGKQGAEGTNKTQLQYATFASKLDGSLQFKHATDNGQSSAFLQITKGEFVHLTIVMNKKSREVEYYIDNTKLATAPCLTNGATETMLKDIQFYIRYVVAEPDYEFYFDNLEIYEMTPAAYQIKFNTNIVE